MLEEQVVEEEDFGTAVEKDCSERRGCKDRVGTNTTLAVLGLHTENKSK